MRTPTHRLVVRALAAGTGQAREHAAEIDRFTDTLQDDEFTGSDACTLFGYLAEHDGPADANLAVDELNPDAALSG